MKKSQLKASDSNPDTLHFWELCGASKQPRYDSRCTEPALTVFTALVQRSVSVQDSSAQLTSDRLSAGPGCNPIQSSNHVHHLLPRSFPFVGGIQVSQEG